MNRSTQVRVGGKMIPFTPMMYDALSELSRGGNLDHNRTHVGRPTKQRIAKFGLASYQTPKDWDGPMLITDEGRRVLEAVARRLSEARR